MQFKNFYATILFSILLFSCVKKPHDVGKDLISSDEYYSIKDTVITNPIIENYKFTTPFGTSGTMVFGKNDSLEAISIFNFSYLINDSLKNVKIDSVELTFISNYNYNISSGKSEFEIYEMPSSWIASSITGDSIKNINFVNKLGIISDTVSNLKMFKAAIDTNIIRKLISSAVDSTKPKFYGFAIKSKISTKGFFGFNSFQSYFPPTIKIKFSKNNKNDSLIFGSGASTFGVIEKIPSLPNQNNLIIQAGVNLRSKIIFDLKNIPSTAIINKATLELELSKKQIGNGTFDSLVVTLVRGNSAKDSLFLFPLYLFKQTADSLSYMANLSLYAQSWVIDSTKNLGFVIRANAENASLNKHEFILQNNSKPKLKITYSQK